MSFKIKFVNGKLVSSERTLTTEQILGLELGFSIYRSRFLRSTSAIVAVDDAELTIPSRPSYTSVDILSSADVLSGQHFSLSDMLCPFVTDEEARNLYSYQEQGSSWLGENREAVLADDMGLGKTVQAITALSNLIKKGAAKYGLVVCTNSLVLNWVSEFQLWAPWLATTPLIASSSGGKEIWKQQCGKAHVVITTYDQLRLYGDYMQGQSNVVIVDEAHRLKNIASARSQAFRKLARDYTWLLTGTPIERDQKDLLTLLTILKPNRFSTRDSWMSAATLRSLAKPYILRRRKEQVLSELPEMTEIVEKIPLSPAQRKSYCSLVMQQPNNYLARFSKLRELCDIDAATGESAKLDRIEEIVVTTKDNGEKSVVFSYWIAPLEELHKRLAKRSELKVTFVDSSFDVVKRNSYIQEFKASGDCLLISGHIGAEGLNLTEANHVIFVNRWWNPSALAQAKDRVRRIGQKKVSFSYSFVAPGTLEDDISRLISKKQLTFNEVVEGVRESLYRPREPVG